MKQRTRAARILTRGMTLFATALAALFFSFFIFHQSAYALVPIRDINDFNSCDWKSASRIECAGYDFYFDAIKSISARHAVFTWRSSSDKTFYLHFNTGAPDQGIVTSSSDNNPQAGAADSVKTKVTSDNQAARKLELGTGNNDPTKWGGVDSVDAEDVSDQAMQRGTREYRGDGIQHYFICGLYTRNGHRCWDMTKSSDSPQLISIKDPDNVIESIYKDIGSQIDSRDNCTADSGAIGFVICPLIIATNNTIKGLIGGDGTSKGFLVELLTVRPLETGDNGIYKAWEGIRNAALGLYIVIFALIVFGNGLGFDPYTIKRALPRLAVGVLLTFASFFIVQTLVDLSNIIGNAIPAFLSALTGNADLANYSLSFDLKEGAIYLILWLVLLFVALGALLVGIAGLVMRVVVIYALVLLAPVAFVAWVLPNTENMFKKWWSNLIKVLMMFPIVTGMLSIAILFQSAILSQGSSDTGVGLGSSVTSTATTIAGAMAPLIAIILIPKTFKWGGEAFAAAAGYLAGKASGMGNAIQGVPGKVSGKAVGGMKDRIMASDFVAERSAKAAANPVLGRIGGKSALRASGRTRSKLSGEAEALTKNMTGGQLERLAKTGTFEERVAAIGALAKRGDRKALSGLSLRSGKTARAYNEASGRYAGDWGKNTDLRRVGGKYTNLSTMSDEDILKLGDDAFAVGLASGTIGYGQALNIAQNPRLSANLTPQKKHDLNTYFKGSGDNISIQGAMDNRKGGEAVVGTRATSDGAGQKLTFTDKSTLATQLEQTANYLKQRYNPQHPEIGPHPETVPVNAEIAPPPVTDSPIKRAVTGPRGQGGYFNPSAFAGSDGGSASTPTTPQQQPAQQNTTPPTYIGPAPQWQPAPPTQPASSNIPPSGPIPSGNDSTVINNITNNVTNNVAQNRTQNAGVVSNPTVMAPVVSDASRQISMLRARGSSSPGLAVIETKLNDLAQMIQRGAVSQQQLRNTIREMREEADNLPDHEKGGAHDVINNLEHQTGQNDTNTGM